MTYIQNDTNSRKAVEFDWRGVVITANTSIFILQTILHWMKNLQRMCHLTQVLFSRQTLVNIERKERKQVFSPSFRIKWKLSTGASFKHLFKFVPTLLNMNSHKYTFILLLFFLLIQYLLAMRKQRKTLRFGLMKNTPYFFLQVLMQFMLCVLCSIFEAYVKEDS